MTRWAPLLTASRPLRKKSLSSLYVEECGLRERYVGEIILQTYEDAGGVKGK
jgi:hypothetical protein